MLILNDFECENCRHVFEDLGPPGDAVTCPECGWDAYRIYRQPPKLSMSMGLDAVGCPTMGDRWARMHERAAREPEDG